MREGKNMGIMTTFKKPTPERGPRGGRDEQLQSNGRCSDSSSLSAWSVRRNLAWRDCFPYEHPTNLLRLCFRTCSNPTLFVAQFWCIKVPSFDASQPLVGKH